MKVEIHLPARGYQQEVIDYFRGGGKRAIEIWHRKAGKDRVATFIESELACKRVGLYWHALPKYEEVRKAVWDAITSDGKRLIDLNFPDAICKKKNAHEMKIELVNGSIWQLVGTDNFNGLVGASPAHVTFSEFAVGSPNAWSFIRPALAQNGGTALFITTPRGYNHAHDVLQQAKARPDTWHWSVKGVNDTGVLSQEIIDEEKASMPDELFRQEYMCDFSAANIGAILGRYMELAERDGRICDFTPDHGPLELSCDIGFRDTTAWWFWQPKVGGYDITDYEEGSGLDADDWIERLKGRGQKFEKIWLPHDARVKTFQSKHSALERFIQAFGADVVRIVPSTKVGDRINAARVVAPRCRFHATRTAQGLAGLRAWAYDYSDETRSFSREPKHDWASHPGDGFSYGAVVMQERVAEAKPAKPWWEEPKLPTLDELWAQKAATGKSRRL